MSPGKDRQSSSCRRPRSIAIIHDVVFALPGHHHVSPPAVKNQINGEEEDKEKSKGVGLLGMRVGRHYVG